MDAKTYAELRELFHTANRIPTSEREGWLAGLDPEQRESLEELLDWDAAPSMLDHAGDGAEQDLPRPENVGEYRVVAEIGSGGMGIVYEAIAPHSQRRVAIKVMRPGVGARRLAGRFSREAQLLSRLDHPGIATVLHSGLADVPWGNMPFLAMERVTGEPLTDYLEAEHRSREERLDLWLQVCEAVEHAHAQGILHRDLKPANVLVTEEGKVKVIDFGVGRSLDPLGQQTLTLDGQVVGTIEFMSPEQLRGDDADRASLDVYALGVLGYHILTERGPFDLGGRSLAEVTQAVLEKTPLRPSSIDPAWRGDIDVILQKCVEVDPNHRYANAAALAEDLRRHLRNEPVLARAASPALRLKKFVRRNPLVSLLGAVLLITLPSAAGVILWKAKEADRRRDSAIAALSFLRNDVLLAAEPTWVPEEDSSLDEALILALDTLYLRSEPGGALAEFPEVRADLHATLGEVFLFRGDGNKALKELERALELINKHDLDPDLESRALWALTRLNHNKGNLERVAELADELERSAKPETARFAMALVARSWSIRDRDRMEEMRSLAWQAQAIFERVLGPAHPTSLNNLTDLAHGYNIEGQRDEAERLFEQVFLARQAHLGERHPQTLVARVQLGLTACHTEPEVGVHHLSEVARLQSEFYGPSNPAVIQSRFRAGRTALRFEAWAPAEVNLKAVEMALGEAGDPTDRTLLDARQGILRIYVETGRIAEAAALLDQLFPLMEDALLPTDMMFLRTQSDLGITLLGLGDTDGGLEALRLAYEGMVERIPARHAELSLACRRLTDALVQTNRFEDALPLLLAEWERSKKYRGEHTPSTHEVLLRLGHTRLVLGPVEEGRALLMQLLDHADAGDPVDRANTDAAHLLLAEFEGR